ncbi:Hcy-binding domain-containing protein [[Candida] zeylanoides]
MVEIKDHLSQGQLVLDGALGTQLEIEFKDILKSKGLDIQHHPLWSALILLKEPDLIQEIHHKYLCSGADIILTATYQASKAGLVKNEGLNDLEIVDLYTKSIDIAHTAQRYYAENENARDTFIGGSIGPYGAYLANGAEYTGEYVDEDLDLAAFHYLLARTLLLDDRVDVLAFETIPNFKEAKQILKLIAQLYADEKKQKYFYLSFNFRDKEHICDGTPISEVMAYVCDKLNGSKVLRENILAVGANCIKFQLADDIVSNIAEFNTMKLPLIVYPNAGLDYDLSSGSYTIHVMSKSLWSESVAKWTGNGAMIVGGCCGSGPRDIKTLSEIVHKLQ